MTRSRTRQNSELADLRARLAIAEETLAAIRNGEVDALLVSGPEGDQVFSLKGAERPYRLLVEAMNEGALTALNDGTVLYCNLRFAEMAGRDIDQMIGSSLFKLVAPEQREGLRGLLRNVSQEGLKAEFELQKSGGAGSLPVQFSLKPLEIDGAPSVAIVATDLNERKSYEAKLLRHNEELERRVRERTKDLEDANHRLQIAQAELGHKAADLETEVGQRTAQLEESVKSLEQFCYTIAHDLRAPLRAMHGFSNVLLNEGSLDQTGRGYAERIANAASRMDLLIRDLLAYGRLNSADIESIPMNVVPVLEEIARSFDQTGATFQINKPIPEVLANPVGLKQVFENLLRNAVKFVAPGTAPRVQIFADQGHSSIRIHIRDNGIGIDPQHHQRIFRVFERLAPGQYPGTGIGLAIVQKGITRMGGKVGLESDPGKGSCFWIELPRATR